MENFKKTLLASFIVGSSSVFAGTMGPVCVDGNVTIPCPSTGFMFEGDALYLKPAFGTDIASLPDKNPAPGGTIEQVNTVHANWNWGFKLEGAYKFDSGNDIDLNWYYYDVSNNGAYNSSRNISTTTDPASAVYTLSQRWSAVNLEFGQHMDLNKVKNIRFHAGLTYALTKFGYSGVVNDTVYGIGNNTLYSKFEGVGPRMGADLSYGLANWLTWSEVLGGWSVYGSGAAALLGGRQNFNEYNYAPSAETEVGAKFGVVPEFDLRLGTRFDYALGQGSLGVNVGYMFVNYFQNFTTGNDDSNYSLNGVYFGARWTGNFL